MVNKLMQPPPDLWEKLKPLARQKRHEPTPAENRLWEHIRNRQEHIRNRQIDNLKFRRQHPIDKFIVDFYCSDARSSCN
jgi:very-short-patch-repair endonuclease